MRLCACMDGIMPLSAGAASPPHARVPQGAYVFAHAAGLGRQVRGTLVKMSIACGLITPKAFTQAQLATASRRLFEGLACVDRYLPTTEMDMKIHGPHAATGAGLRHAQHGGTVAQRVLYGSAVRLIGNRRDP